VKKSLVLGLTAAALAFAFVLAFALPADAARSPFTGAWVATDVDGSSMIMAIGGGRSSHRVFYFDRGASVCGWDGTFDPTTRAFARGRLSVSGNVLSGDLPVYCTTRPPSYEGDFTFTITYDAGSDTLIDTTASAGTVIWSRR
jgi:hypothetical protein